MAIPGTFKVFIVLMLLPAMFCACKQGLTNNHLPQKEMQKILLDINLAEAYSINAKDSLHKGNIKNTDSLSAYYKIIFDHYKITPQQFNNSLEWYKSHPEELDSVYNKMIPVASRWQTVNAAKKTAKDDSVAKNVPDTLSIKKADTVLLPASSKNVFGKALRK